MDIEEECNDFVNNRSSSLDRNRISQQSRKSCESFLSIGGSQYSSRPSLENQK